MSFYFILIFVLVVTSQLFKRFVRPSKRLQFVTIWGGILLIIFSAFRTENFGADTETYVNAYKTIANADWGNVFRGNILKAFEPGYVFLCKVLSLINTSDRFFLIWTSLLGLIPVMYFVGKYSKNPILSYVLYIITNHYLFEMDVIRQSIAMGLVLIAFSIVFENKHRWGIKAVLLILVASTIHTAALVGLLLVPLACVKKINGRYYLGAGLIAGLLLIFGYKLTSAVINYIPGYSKYVEMDTGGLGRLFIGFAVLIFFLMYKKNYYMIDSKARWWEHILVVSIGILILSYSFLAASRAVLILNFAYCVIIPNLIHIVKGRDKLIWTTVIIVAYVSLFIIGFDPRYSYVFMG